MTDFDVLVSQVRACTTCISQLPHGVRPVFQAHPDARILIAGQAPGRRVHESGIPFDDRSGERLRDWMGVEPATFYDPTKVAILPMSFCYPGTGNAGDLPPRPECAPAWRSTLLSALTRLELTLVIGQYARAYHLPESRGTLTSCVMAWREYLPSIVPLPHPSPRNNRWFSRNPWFDTDLIPALRTRVRDVLERDGTSDPR